MLGLVAVFRWTSMVAAVFDFNYLSAGKVWSAGRSPSKGHYHTEANIDMVYRHSDTATLLPRTEQPEQSFESGALCLGFLPPG